METTPSSDDMSQTSLLLNRRESSVSQVSNDSSSDGFMTLVDAAASLLDNVKEEEKKAKRPETKQIGGTSSEVSPTLGPNGEAKRTGGKKESFAEHLMSVLDDEANHDTIAWMPSGTAFTITNHRKFVNVSMPKLFNIRNMSSFVRKLSRYGFSRVHDIKTQNSDVFKHPKFQRGNKKLLTEVICLGSSSNSNMPRPTFVRQVIQPTHLSVPPPRTPQKEPSQVNASSPFILSTPDIFSTLTGTPRDLTPSLSFITPRTTSSFTSADSQLSQVLHARLLASALESTPPQASPVLGIRPTSVLPASLLGLTSPVNQLLEQTLQQHKQQLQHENPHLIRRPGPPSLPLYFADGPNGATLPARSHFSFL